jgi:prepilin-type N-terminal cleavage/methylation domain-containing protein
MKQLYPGSYSKRTAAFTLIEMLVVIAIIAVLAALLVPVGTRISENRMQSVAKAELTQIATAIDNYKAKYNFYPPDGTNPPVNPLYFELSGTILANDATGYYFITLDKRSRIYTNSMNVPMGVTGLANSSTTPQGTDDRPAPVAFLKDLKPAQLGSASGVTNLLCSQEWTKPGGNAANPWRYVSSNPTNNPGTYDLWVDLWISGKTHRICNWSKQPIIF